MPVIALAACSSEASEPVAEPLAFQASDASRRLLGVKVWGLGADGDSIFASGYDAEGRRHFGIRLDSVSDETSRSFRTEITGAAAGSSNVVLSKTAIDGAFELKTTEGTLDNAARLALSSFAQDLSKAQEEGYLENRVPLGADLHSPLRVRNGLVGGNQRLTNSVRCLLNNCHAQLLEAAVNCVQLVVSGVVLASKGACLLAAKGVALPHSGVLCAAAVVAESGTGLGSVRDTVELGVSCWSATSSTLQCKKSSGC